MDHREKITKALVSIILPTWNRSRLLRSAIEKIRTQTYKNFELIVVDDGSHDDTREVMKRIMDETNDPRIQYIRLAQHEGGAQARNHAIRASQGEFIASQDDDDEWFPEFLEKQVARLSSLPSEYGMSYTSYFRVSGSKKIKMPPASFRPKEGALYGGDIMKKNYHPYQASLIRKSVLDDVGLVNEKLNSLYDWEMWLRIGKKYKTAHVPEPLLIVNNTPNSNSSDPKKIWWRIDARKLILSDFGDDIRRFGYFPDHASSLADLLIGAGDISQARSYLIKGIRVNPFRVVLWLKLVASFFGKKGYGIIQGRWRK